MSASSLSNSGSPRPTGTPARRDADARAAGVAGLAQLVHVGLELRHVGASGAKNGLSGTCSQRLERDRDLADLRHAAANDGAVLLRQPLLARPRRRPPIGAVSRAEERPPPRGSRRPYLCQVGVVGMAGAEGSGRSRRSPCCAGRCCGSAGAIGVPVVLPSYTPDRISTWSASWRWVTWRLVPGRRRSRSGWMSASDSAMPGGQPSITQPMAGPWVSPKLVTANSSAEGVAGHCWGPFRAAWRALPMAGGGAPGEPGILGGGRDPTCPAAAAGGGACTCSRCTVHEGGSQHPRR